MARRRRRRGYVRVSSDIWDPWCDFRSLGAGAQRLYFLMLGQRHVAPETVEVDVVHWATLAQDTKPCAVRSELRELEHAGYVRLMEIEDGRPGRALVRQVATFLRSDIAIGVGFGDREPISLDLRLRVLERDGWACVRCRSTDDLHIDHRLPVALGGRSTFENLQVLCRRHNLEKGAQHPDVWEASCPG